MESVRLSAVRVCKTVERTVVSTLQSIENVASAGSSTLEREDVRLVESREPVDVALTALVVTQVYIPSKDLSLTSCATSCTVSSD